jgi:hypothetical protein
VNDEGGEVGASRVRVDPLEKGLPIFVQNAIVSPSVNETPNTVSAGAM